MKRASCRQIAEFQGPYGPLLVLENRIQQLWAFQHLQPGNWRTVQGQQLRVRSPGRWNHGAGPDFLEASVELDGEVLLGDVEIHIHREDWWRHGHNTDPRYDRVILHVVLFAGGMERTVLSSAGGTPAEWVMGPWTREDIEAICGGPPGVLGELVPEMREWMEDMAPFDTRQRLRTGADRRWQDKVSMARCLHGGFGWDGALHRLTLFYLGFPYNRRAFFEMADQYGPAEWRHASVIDEIRSRWSSSVQWRMGRPANWAEHRLHQYQMLSQSIPGWIQHLQRPPRKLCHDLELAVRGGHLPIDTRSIRRKCRFSAWQRWLRRSVLGALLPTGLTDRLWLDGFLPLLVAGQRLSGEAGHLLWFHGPAGSFPDAYRGLVKLAEIMTVPERPLCNGWVQGMLWMEDQLRLERIRSHLGPSPAVGT